MTNNDTKPSFPVYKDDTRKSFTAKLADGVRIDRYPELVYTPSL